MEHEVTPLAPPRTAPFPPIDSGMLYLDGRTCMRPALHQPVSVAAPRLGLGRRLRLGTLLTVLMMACYGAIICSLGVFFSGVLLTAEHVASGAAFATEGMAVARASTWQSSTPSQIDLAREVDLHRQQIRSGSHY